ncbi:MAG: LacI family DNA-binding transcriptional regulator [Sphingobacteriales bacterium]|nr:LacI family DNA-binding transcriptional regulator [Sphingobacteriales bacterium]
MNNVNIKRLAAELNLSISTVSRALQNSSEIGEKTKVRVRALAKKLNYQPNHYAAGLRKKQSHTIAVVVPEVADNFFSLVIDGIDQVAQTKGYQVLIFLTRDDYAKEVNFIRHLQSGRVDGVLISVSSESRDNNHLHELNQKNIPVVFFDRVFEDIPTAKITTDDYKASYKATKQLISKGCKKIACLAIPENLLISRKRVQGYMDALEDSGLQIDLNLVVHCDNHDEENHKIIHNLIEKYRPDGIFSSVEKLALHTYQSCIDLKIDIPNELKIISFSSLKIAPLLQPPLSTITQPAFEMGKAAAEILFKALQEGKSDLTDDHIEMESEIVLRDSSI